MKVSGMIRKPFFLSRKENVCKINLFSIISRDFAQFSEKVVCPFCEGRQLSLITALKNQFPFVLINHCIPYILMA